MADDEGRREALLRSKLDKVWKNPRCELCGADSWSASPTIRQLERYLPAGPCREGYPIPLVAIICDTCGNTKLLDGVKLGVIDLKTGGWVDE